MIYSSMQQRREPQISEQTRPVAQVAAAEFHVFIVVLSVFIDTKHRFGTLRIPAYRYENATLTLISFYPALDILLKNMSHRDSIIL